MEQRSLNPRGVRKQPVAQIFWIHRSQIKPNGYNPNSVAPPEMDLLKYSIMRIGWVFPILLVDEGKEVATTLLDGLLTVEKDQHFTIIDGFHRYTISGDTEVYAMTEGYVPVVFIPGDDVRQYTVMMNRAKGSHAVLAMSNIIVELLQQGYTAEQIQRSMGMDKDEVIRLANGAGITKDQALNGLEFSQSWKPK
jgi:hypothetical protein